MKILAKEEEDVAEVVLENPEDILATPEDPCFE